MDRSAASDTMAVFLLIVGFISFLQRFYSGRKIDLDNIEIFREHPIVYTQTYHHPINPVVHNKPVKKKNTGVRNATKVKHTQQTVVSTPKSNNDDFKQDCLKALISLGTRKKEAQIIVKQVFDQYNPTTIQDFIQLAYTKP